MRADSTIQWQAYPALLFAGSMAMGIFVATKWPTINFWFWICLAITGLVDFFASGYAARHNFISLVRLHRTLVAFLLVFAIGGARYKIFVTYPSYHIINRLGTVSETVNIEGIVQTFPTEYDKSIRFVLVLKQIVQKKDTLHTAGKVQISIDKSTSMSSAPSPEFRPGDVIRLYCDIQRLQKKRNPSDFDYQKYLNIKDIHARCFVDDLEEIYVLKHSNRWTFNSLSITRSYIRRQIDIFVPFSTSKAVLHALLLGDRSKIDDDTRDRFARSGLLHLLAVSGLHVLLVGMVIYELLRSFLLRMRMKWKAVELCRAILTTAVLLFYMILVGSRSSVNRAVLMTILFMIANVLQRKSNPLNTIGVAAFLLLVYQPSQLFDVGFQLSFAAVSAIITLNPIISIYTQFISINSFIYKNLISIINLSLCATIGTMPVLLYHFGSVSFAGLFFNIPAIPLTFLTLAAGLIMLIFSFFCVLPTVLLGNATSALASLLLYTAEVGDTSLSWLSLSRYLENPFFIVAFVLCIIAIAQWPRPRNRWRLLTAMLFFLSVGIFTNLFESAYRPKLSILFFDVGQGDAILVSFPNGKHVLIDAGQRYSNTDQAIRTILPHLKRQHVKQLDAVIITHQHSDHIGGIPTILRSIHVNRLIYNGDSYASSLYSEMEHLCDSLYLLPHVVSAGDTLNIDPTVRIQILSPSASSLFYANTNDMSIIFRMVYGENVFLFTGDAEVPSENKVVRYYGPLLSSDVVKVGHHGSSTSSSAPFVQRVVSSRTYNPTAVVSVGQNNRFNHPNMDIMNRWQQAGAHVLKTSTDHAVWFICDGKYVERTRWK